MTAIVGILNKRAAVMAADSALTVSRGDRRKIYNDETKIFRLSDSNPVGMMLFSSVEFMKTPWNVIAELYRAKKGGEKFYSLRDYVNNFLGFIANEPLLGIDEEAQHNYLLYEMGDYLSRVQKNAMTDEDARQEVIRLGMELNEDNVRNMMNDSIMNVIQMITDEVHENDVCPLLEGYSFQQFRKYAKNDFDILMDHCKEEGIPGVRSEWEHAIYEYMKSSLFYNGTGLVFVGFGENELYPSLIPVYVSGVFDGKLRYAFNESEEAIISKENPAAIQPFAQTDVMITMMKGIAPDLYSKAHDMNQKSIENTKLKMIEAMREEGVDESVIENVLDVDMSEVEESFGDTMLQYVQDEYVDGIIDAVDSFNINDMANMAENLVSITNLQRHMTSSEESVGGPVDVAVITRKEGFKWVKHKHWYDKEMN